MQNFATTISPWIVPVHALEQFTCAGYDHQPPLLPYLQDGTNTNFDIPLTVALRRKLLPRPTPPRLDRLTTLFGGVWNSMGK